MQESINKELEGLKNKHIETNNTIIEIKSTQKKLRAEYLKQKKESDDKMLEITSEKQNKVKRMKRTEDSLRDFWDNISCI